MNAIGKCIEEDGALDFHKIIVEKSTVPVGTHLLIKDILSDYLTRIPEYSNKSEDYFTIVSVPEFLAEGSAI